MSFWKFWKFPLTEIPSTEYIGLYSRSVSFRNGTVDIFGLDTSHLQHVVHDVCLQMLGVFYP